MSISKKNLEGNQEDIRTGNRKDLEPVNSAVQNPNDFGELGEEIYKENILDHYRNPRNAGVLKDYSFKNKEFNHLCGDVVEIFVRLDITGKVSETRFSGRGCAISQASASMLTDHIKGRALDDLRKIKREDMLEMLGIKIGVVRMKCALLSLKALLKGVDKMTERSEAIGKIGE